MRARCYTFKKNLNKKIISPAIKNFTAILYFFYFNLKGGNTTRQQFTTLSTSVDRIHLTVSLKMLTGTKLFVSKVSK